MLNVFYSLAPLEFRLTGILELGKVFFAAGALGDSICFDIFVVYQFHPGTWREVCLWHTLR
jgi:hypothetical protein